mgnify:CR=1 FL=1
MLWPPLLAGLGASLCIGLLAGLSQLTDVKILIVPFGATMVIVFALPSSPLAQPRNVIGGHVLTAALGLVLLFIANQFSWPADHPMWLAMASGLGLALMMLCRCVHPPAGANPLLVLMVAPSWQFLITPVLSGAVLIVLFAVAFFRHSEQRYPLSGWWS